MKRFNFIGSYLILVLVVCLGVVLTCCTSCKDKLMTPPVDTVDPYEYVDSITMASIKAAIVNPTFGTPTEMLDFRSRCIEDAKADSIFTSLSEKTLLDVYTVCSKKYKSVTKTIMIDEYRANKSVYDNLINTSASTTTPTAPSVTQTNQQQTRAVSNNNYSSGDTVINGDKYHVQVTYVPYE